MNTRELRIGNLIQDINGYTIEVESLNNFGGDEINEYSCMGAFNPINLTEEWLMMFGFEIEDRITENHKWNDYKKNSIVIEMPYLEFNFNNGDSTIEIKYVHQLQNLFYCLTGKELSCD